MKEDSKINAEDLERKQGLVYAWLVVASACFLRPEPQYVHDIALSSTMLLACRAGKLDNLFSMLRDRRRDNALSVGDLLDCAMGMDWQDEDTLPKFEEQLQLLSTLSKQAEFNTTQNASVLNVNDFKTLAKCIT